MMISVGFRGDRGRCCGTALAAFLSGMDGLSGAILLERRICCEERIDFGRLPGDRSGRCETSDAAGLVGGVFV